MKFTKTLSVLLLFQCLSLSVLGQQNLVYNHYFLNPYLYNPSYIASDGYSELYLNYRKQWAGFEGAPQTITANIQIPVNHKIGVAVNFYNDKVGVLQTNSGLLSFAYKVYLGKSYDVPHTLAFGLSIGATMSGVDRAKISGDFDENLKQNTSGLDGQAGLSYQYRNLKIGFAIPRVFNLDYISEKSGFSKPGVSQIKNSVTAISYNFVLSPKLSFEPIALYRTNEISTSQFEGTGVLRFTDIGWIGGSYRQDYGPSAFLGFVVKEKLKFGYAYEFAPTKIATASAGSHEVQVILRLGKKKHQRPEKKQPPVTDNVEEPTQEDNTEVASNEPAIEDPKQTEPAKNEPVGEPVKTEVAKAPAKDSSVVTTSPSEQNPVTQNTPAQTTVTQTAPAQKEQTPKVNSDKATSLNGNELKPGHYVVVGAFRLVSNARTYVETLKRSGYPAEIAFDPARQYYIVHIANTGTLDEARELRNVYRQKSRYSFRDSWILTVE